MAKFKRKTVRLICFPVIGLIAALMIAVDIVLPIFYNIISPWVHPPIVDSLAASQSAASGEELSRQVLAEGAVLVKNNGTLPLDSSVNSSADVYGWGSSDAGWVVGGSGSGQVKQASPDSFYAETTFVDALKEYGITNNDTLTMYYNSYCNERPGMSAGTLGTTPDEFYILVEPEYSSLPSATSDTAFIVLSRTAGESDDAPRVQYKYNGQTDTTRTYLEISEEEEEMIRNVAASHENVIVIINSTNVMELGFLDTIEGIDACLIVGGTGINAASVLPEIIYGEISPSGKLADTYAYEFESAAAYDNSGLDGTGVYTNGDNLLLAGTSSNASPTGNHGKSYLDYVEGIYVGYKWYETADCEGVWDNISNQYGTGYEAVVQYPFGYGLSYVDEEDFVWEVTSLTIGSGEDVEDVQSGFTFTGEETDDTVTMTVRVTNNGTMSAKDVVELYVTAPYTDGGIEKSYVSLVAYAKTSTIEAGGYADVTLSFSMADLASYDAYDANGNGHYGYELESGQYMLKLMTDAHTVKENVTILGGSYDAEENEEADETSGEGIITFTVRENDKGNGVLYDASRNVTDSELNTNKFTGDQAYDGTSIDASDEVDGGLTFVSRSTMTAVAKVEDASPARTADRAISDEARAIHRYTDEMKEEWDNATTDIFGNPVDTTSATFGTGGSLSVTSGTSVSELGIELGGNYDDERWSLLLSQATLSEMETYIGFNALSMNAVDSIGLPALYNIDGPQQIGGFADANYRTTGFPNATVMAQTWNTELIVEVGEALGSEGKTLGVDGWLGPAVNIHRSPLGGRNYEYYSEDSLLSGTMATAAIRGAKNSGMYTYLKHFAIYEQESNRDTLFTWLSEQALREIYLKPFEIAVKSEGGATGIMTSYGRIGAVWSGGSESLITGVLRNEWGFNGAVITDWADYQEYMNIDQALRAGGTRYMANTATNPSGSGARYEAQVYNAFKSDVYIYLSAAYQNANPVAGEGTEITSTVPSFAWLIAVVVDLNIFVFAALAFWTQRLIRNKDKPDQPLIGKKEEQKA